LSIEHLLSRTAEALMEARILVSQDLGIDPHMQGLDAVQQHALGELHFSHPTF
jgi:hypothetical protein